MLMQWVLPVAPPILMRTCRAVGGGAITGPGGCEKNRESE